jgi:hypothetical protein
LSRFGCGCKSDIAYDLAKIDLKIMLGGCIGQGAINKLSSQNMEVIRNCRGYLYELPFRSIWMEM